MTPRFEDLLNEDEGPVRFDDLVQEGGEVEEAPGVLRTFGRHFRQGVNPLWDEGAGFMGANLDAGKHLLETGRVVTPSEWLEGYRRNRDESRDTDARGAQANPTAATAGRVTGAVVQGVAAGGAGGLGQGFARAVTSGATQGAANALAGSEADLTRADGEAYARAFTDALQGGTVGAAGGALGYGAGKALGYIGGKARDAYRSARGTLADEARAGLDAEADALRAADDAAALRMEREQGRAMDANRRFDAAAERQSARAARDAQRAAEREARAAQATADRLERDHGQALAQNRRVDAQRAQADARAARVAQREAEARAMASQREAEALEKAQGQALEMNKGVDARAAREEARRVAQEARAAARAQRTGQPSAGGPAAPQVPGRRRFVGDPNVDPDTRVLKGYEGGARRRRVDNAPKVLDARARLARTDITPAERAELEAYVAGHGNAVDNPPAFRLAVIEEELVKRGYSPDVVRRAMARFDSQGRAVSRSAMQGTPPAPSAPPPAPAASPGMTAAERDAFHAQVLRDYPSVQDARPLSDATRARVERDVARVNRGAWDERTMLPERTAVAEPADWLKRGHDPMEVVRQGGGGSAWEGRADFNDAKTKLSLIRTTPEEGVGGNAFTPSGDAHKFEFRAPDGTIFEAKVWYAPESPEELVINSIHPKGVKFGNYLELSKEYAGRMGAKNMRQVFEELRRYFPEAKKVTAIRASGWNPDRDMAMRLPNPKPEGAVTYEFPARNGQRRLFSNEGHGPYKDWPEREPTFNDAMPRGEYELPGEPTSEFDMRGAFPERAPEPLPPMEELTQPGQPMLPDSVQRYDVLGARPAPRPGQPYASYGAPRRSALPPEEVAAAEEAMAARRAAAFGSGPRGPAPEPTAGARPRALPESSMRAPEDGPPLPEPTDTGLDARFEPTFAEGTRATRVPEVRRGAMRPEATTVPHPPEATQVGGPSALTERTRYAPPSMDQRLAGRPSVDELVDQRIAQGGGALRGAFWRGTTGESGALAGVAGLALGGPSGSLKALALRGGLEVVREALRNPAAKARAIEAFKLQRLAAIRPDVWGRVSATLARAAQRDEQAGTDYHLRAARHALLQTDPAFRAAEAEAAKGLQGLSEDELARRLSQ